MRALGNVYTNFEFSPFCFWVLSLYVTDGWTDRQRGARCIL